MKRFLLILTASIVAASCSSKPEPPEHLISEETYIDLLIELQLLKTYQSNSRADSVQIDSLLTALFQKYEVTKQQFKRSHAYYQNQLENQEKRLDKAIESLSKDRVQLPSAIETDSAKQTEVSSKTEN